jgi:hypothetical protein
MSGFSVPYWAFDTYPIPFGEIGDGIKEALAKVLSSPWL